VSLELVVAMGILLTILMPLAYSFVQEQRLARIYYLRAVAMEIVDGETELLAAGGWRAFGPGAHAYQVEAGAARNLPPGRFTLTIGETELRLEWRPAGMKQGGAVWRTAALGDRKGAAP
jgi:hypothetical protein